MDLVQAQLPGHRLTHRLGVAGEHDGLPYAGRLQVPEGFFRPLLHLVGDDDVAHIDPVHRHMDDGAHVVAGVLEGNVKLVHKLLIARQDGLSVHHRPDTVAGDLLGVGDPVGVRGGLAGRLDGPGDGVVGLNRSARAASSSSSPSPTC